MRFKDLTRSSELLPAVGPVAAAVFPVVSLYSTNPATRFTRILPSFVVLGVLACCTYLLFRAYTRSAAKGSLAATLFFGVTFAFGPIVTGHDTGDPLVDANRRVLLTNIYLTIVLLYAAFALLVRRSKSTFETTARVTSIIALCVLGVAAAQALWWGVSLRFDRTTPAVGADVARSAVSGKTPDIYHIILDGYSRADVMREAYGLDNSEFVRALESRGFYVAAESHSNYNQTYLSLASMLNFNYLEDSPPINPDLYRARLAETMVRQNAVVDFLRQHGYTYVHVGSSFDATASNPHADVQITSSDAIDVGEFELQILLQTPLRQFDKLSNRMFRTMDRNRILSQLHGIGRASLQPGPKYVFAHVICPHPPFVFAADGGDSGLDLPPTMDDGAPHEGGPEAYREGYRNQVQYLNIKVLEVVDTILAHYDTDDRPVIVISGDHGGGLNYDLRSPMEMEQWGRMSILNAYLVPEGAFDLYPTITPVNSYRMLFDGLFGANLPLLPDRSFASPWLEPSKHIEIPADALVVPQPKAVP